MKRIVILIGCVWAWSVVGWNAHAQEVQWASKVINFSSQFVEQERPKSPQYQAVQVLGKPNKMPAVGQSPCAWSPERDGNPDGEWIKVGFERPIKIEQVAIAENYNPGSITHVYVYDAADKETLIYRNLNVSPLAVGGRIFQIFQKTDFEVAAVKIMMNTAKIPGFNQIDAIGISNSTQPIEAKINLAEKMGFKSKPENLGTSINSVYGEIAPVVSPDGSTLYFTRAKHPNNIGNAEKQDVWYSELQPDNKFGEAKNIGSPVNTPQHNSSFSISPDGNTMLLNNIYNIDGTMERGLSITKRTSKTQWGNPEKVSITDYYNRSPYSEFCLSQDGKVLLMTIQRTDSYGDKDLYYARLKDDGTWAAPENLGSAVNTAATETSPFLASDGKTLYYSTNGLSGYGSSDIFVTRRLDDTWKNWSEPQNLGPEVNTADWEAYFSITAKADFAYFASYHNSMGESDIFRIRLAEENKPDPVALIKGKVYNKKTNQPIQARILYEILPAGTNAGNATSNPENGDYKVVLPLKKNYGILAEAKGFLSVDDNIDLTNQTEYIEITKDLYLVPIEEGATFTLNNIFFEPTKFTLLPESIPELNRLIKVLQDNPTMRIRLEGHTEIFGKEKEQMKLGENRVKSVKRYVVENGRIEESRVETKSFGGKKPLTNARDDQSRASNRRVEIRILRQ